MIFLTKLFLSAATLCFGVGYAARIRANPLHRRVMALGLAVAWLGAAVLVIGRVGFGLPAGPAFWLVELAGSERAAATLAMAQQGLAALTLLLLCVQAVLGGMAHWLHRPLGRGVLAAWLVVWISSMFGYV